MKFEVDETFEPLSNYMPQKSIEGTAWDDNPIVPVFILISIFLEEELINEGDWWGCEEGQSES